MEYINDILGIKIGIYSFIHNCIDSTEAVRLLKKMGVQSEIVKETKLLVSVPFYRSDIL